MVENTIQHGSRQHRIPHHFRPVHNLLIRCKDKRGSLISIADEGKKTIGLTAGDWRISNFINDKQLCLFQISETETGGSLCFCCVQNLYKVYHFFETHSITIVDGVEPQPP